MIFKFFCKEIRKIGNRIWSSYFWATVSVARFRDFPIRCGTDPISYNWHVRFTNYDKLNDALHVNVVSLSNHKDIDSQHNFLNLRMYYNQNHLTNCHGLRGWNWKYLSKTPTQLIADANAKQAHKQDFHGNYSSKKLVFLLLKINMQKPLIRH